MHKHTVKLEIDSWKRFAPDELNQYCKRPIFIVGSPRSGTTVMRYIIDAHPKIFCPHLETFLFSSLKATISGHIWEYQFSKSIFEKSDYTTWIRDFALQLFANYGKICGKKRFAEKTPSHSFEMGIIKEIFSDAIFIHMIRNGLEVVKSLMNMPWASNDVEKNVNTWVSSVKTAKKFGYEFGNSDYLEVKYESLCSDYREQIQNICDFIGEKFSEKMVDYHDPKNNSWNIALPKFSPDGANKSRHKSLSKKNLEIFWKNAEDLMLELGYF